MEIRVRARVMIKVRIRLGLSDKPAFSARVKGLGPGLRSAKICAQNMR